MSYVKQAVELMIKNKITVATAESCTGGLIAKLITDFAGVSDIYSEGYVTYSNDAKIKNLGVLPETLNEFGAVSKNTAEEMANGVRLRSNSHIGISTTGIAGPGGATPTKPVGLVYIAVSTPEKCIVKELHHSGTREEIRQKTAEDVFCLLTEVIKKSLL